MIDHDWRSYDLIARAFDGNPGGLSRDDILDNITLFWLTNASISAARLYWENKLAFLVPKNVKVPAAVSAFPDELYQAPRNWVERAYPKLTFYNKQDEGVTSQHGNNRSGWWETSAPGSRRCGSSPREPAVIG